jgi:hypothetical protein
MHLVPSDILGDACGLSLGLILVTVPIGLVLWLLGWWSHRFWVVLFATVLAGVYGLQSAQGLQASGLAGAVLMALSAGVLALALVRLVAFAAGGLAGLLLVQAAYPTLNQPLIVFLIAGLICLFLFRPCMMALTSLAGALTLTCAALMLLNYYTLLDAPAWSEHSSGLLNGIAGVLTLVGFLVQFLLDRYLFRSKPKSKSWVGEIWGMFFPGGKSGKVPSARRAA